MKKVILSLLSAILLPLCISAQTTTQDDGYFLSLKQKGQLIWRGRIQDAQGSWYDVYICPGYTHPILYGREKMQKAGNNFSEYVHKEKYSKIREHSGDAFNWAFKDCFHDYVWEGTGKAWDENFSAAKKRIEKRIFGWWLSYPWALMQSTVDNAIRIPVGLSGTALGTAWGGAVVPSAGMVDSSVEGIWHAGAGGLALPASGLAWNTLVSPPLALFGQKPAKERADGFWVRSVSSGTSFQPNEKEFAALIEWGLLLQRELATYKKQREVVDKNTSDQMDVLYGQQRQLRQKATKEEIKITQQEKMRVQVLLTSAATHCQQWSAPDIKEQQDAICRQLEKQTGLSKEEKAEILNLLEKYPPSPLNSSAIIAPKTDPMRESIEVIKAVSDSP